MVPSLIVIDVHLPPCLQLIGLLMGGCARGLLMYQVSSLERGDAQCCAPAETISKES